MFSKRRGQSSLDYAVIIVAAVAALVALHAYMKRSIQGRLRASSDQIGDQFDPANFQFRRTVSGGVK